jgi:hypothetical protein
MDSPEKPAKMVDSVKPVKHEVLSDEQNDPVSIGIAEFCKTELIKIIKDNKANTANKYVEAKIKCGQIYVRQSAFNRIIILMMQVTE